MSLVSIQHLAQLSRDKRFLIRTSLSVVAMSIGLSFLLSTFARKGLGVILEDKAHNYETLTDTHSPGIVPRSVNDWIFWIRFGYPSAYESAQLDFRDLDDFERGSIPSEDDSPFSEFPMLEPYYEGMTSDDRTASIARLKAMPDGQRYRNEFLGDLYVLNGNHETAATYYEKEAVEFSRSSYAQRSAVMAAIWNNDTDKAKSLITQTEFADQFHAHELLNVQADAHAWFPLLISTIQYDFRATISFFAIPAAFTGLIWYLILTNFWKVNRTRFIASLCAITAGVFSAMLTLFAVMVQERAFGFTHDPSGTQLSQAIYFVSGVGLREETIKLLCFLPIAFWCARRKNDLEALILAGLVGLGFAMQENVSYFRTGLIEQASLTRLLTANPLHFALTGLVGYYAYRMIRRKFHGWEEFLATFILAVLLHGAYDAVIMIPEWRDYSILTFILMALLVYRYFDPLRDLMDIQGQRRRLSTLGIFVLGAVAITCIVMIVSAPFVGFTRALAHFAEAVGSTIPLAFAYISRFRDL